MAFVTAGLSNGGRTAHFEIEYDDSLRSPETANALIETSDADFELMSRWFQGVELSASPLTVRIVAAEPPGPLAAPVDIFPGPGARPLRVRYLFVAAISRRFMRSQDRGWLGADGSGAGPALSRFLGAQALAANGLGVPELDLQPANSWMDSPRDDYVNDPAGSEPAVGCGVLFLYYLFTERKFSVAQIIAAAAPDLGGVYRNLTGETGDPFPQRTPGKQISRDENDRRRASR